MTPFRAAAVGLLALVTLLPGGGAASARTLSAQTLSGRVTGEGGAQLEGVRLRLLPVGALVSAGAPVAATLSDREGEFAFGDLVDGEYRLLAEAPGWEPWLSDPLALRADDPIRVVLAMSAAPLGLEPLVVTASRRPWWEVVEPPGLWGFHDRMDRYALEGRGRFFTRTDVAPWRGVPVARALAAVVPFLRTRGDPRRPGQVLLRGPGDCRPIVFIDGRFVELAPRGAGRGVVDEIPLDLVVDAYSLYAVEVYRGMGVAPAELSAPSADVDPRCSVLGIWTRRR